MKPYYFRSAFRDIALEDILSTTPWIQVTDARLECFMSASTETYTYGEGRGVRTYTPVPYSPLVLDIQRQLNRDDIGGLDGAARDVYSHNVCFLNRYDNAAMQLGWHSDDSPGMDHEHPIAVARPSALGERDLVAREGPEGRHPARPATAPGARVDLRHAGGVPADPPAPHPQGRQADVHARIADVQEVRALKWPKGKPHFEKVYDRATATVDRKKGYTIDFAPDKALHQDLYFEEYDRLVRTGGEDPGIMLCEHEPRHHYLGGGIRVCFECLVRGVTGRKP